MTLREFYWICNSDPAGWKRYTDLLNALITVYDDEDDPLSEEQQKALIGGDPYKVKILATTDSDKLKLQTFFEKVQNDRVIMPKFAAFREKMILAHGQALSQTQKDVVNKGDAKDIADVLTAENGGTALGAFGVAWTSRCSLT